MRPFLSIIWSLFAMASLWFILVKYGDKTEILTLLIGFITGTVIGSIFGVYFNDSHKQPPHDEVK